MDEYRPFPSQQPVELTTDEHPQPEASTPAAAERESALTDRAAPDTEHPGGHLHGVVARLNRPRRFGFLRAADGVEVFFHASAIDTGPKAFDALRAGQEVEFDCHQDEQGRGLAATLVTIVGEPPEPVRPPAGARAERQERAGRGAKGTAGAGSADRWHVAVLRDRYDSPASTQLERLLNERGVKPGQFTLALLERNDGTECWIAYHTGPAESGQK
ncbi:MAG: cold shock domain-containing protein [Chloroflexi bacterium]|nr:cold shock domain-containing protein [Chloroflexota bacterium]